MIDGLAQKVQVSKTCLTKLTTKLDNLEVLDKDYRSGPKSSV